jgi:hypothetical protein
MRGATDFALRDQKRGSGPVEQENQNYFKCFYILLCHIKSNKIDIFQKTKYQPNTDILRYSKLSKSMRFLQIRNGYMHLIGI